MKLIVAAVGTRMPEWVETAWNDYAKRLPPDCALEVGGVEHAWTEGHCVTFDDTFLHAAWNRSDRLRVVMILDTWHPRLREVEVQALKRLVETIGDFNTHAGLV